MADRALTAGDPGVAAVGEVAVRVARRALVEAVDAGAAGAVHLSRPADALRARAGGRVQPTAVLGDVRVVVVRQQPEVERRERARADAAEPVAEEDLVRSCDVPAPELDPHARSSRAAA